MADEQEYRLFAGFPSRLHQGEASSLAIASHRGWLFLSDDLDARATAIKSGIRLSGSLQRPPRNALVNGVHQGNGAGQGDENALVVLDVVKGDLTPFAVFEQMIICVVMKALRQSSLYVEL